MRAKTSEKNRLKIGEYLITTTATLLSKTPKKNWLRFQDVTGLSIFSLWKLAIPCKHPGFCLRPRSASHAYHFLPAICLFRPCCLTFLQGTDMQNGSFTHLQERKVIFVRNHSRFLFLRPSPKNSKPRKKTNDFPSLPGQYVNQSMHMSSLDHLERCTNNKG